MANEVPSVAWLLLALACVATLLGAKPEVRRQWRWGRTATSIPMSGAGAVVAIGTLWWLTAAAFGLLPFWAIFLALPLLLVGAMGDAWRAGRARRRDPGHGGDAGGAAGD